MGLRNGCYSCSERARDKDRKTERESWQMEKIIQWNVWTDVKKREQAEEPIGSFA